MVNILKVVLKREALFKVKGENLELDNQWHLLIIKTIRGLNLFPLKWDIQEILPSKVMKGRQYRIKQHLPSQFYLMSQKHQRSKN